MKIAEAQVSSRAQKEIDKNIAASFERGNIYSWAEISKIHKTRCGIYQKNGVLVSLLTDFGRINPCYPDKADESGERIFYTGNGRRGNQTLSSANRALLDAIETAHAVPLFNKLAVGRWEFFGFWRVVKAEYLFDEKSERMIWRFLLVNSK